MHKVQLPLVQNIGIVIMVWDKIYVVKGVKMPRRTLATKICGFTESEYDEWTEEEQITTIYCDRAELWDQQIFNKPHCYNLQEYVVGYIVSTIYRKRAKCHHKEDCVDEDTCRCRCYLDGCTLQYNSTDQGVYDASALQDDYIECPLEHLCPGCQYDTKTVEDVVCPRCCFKYDKNKQFCPMKYSPQCVSEGELVDLDKMFELPIAYYYILNDCVCCS